MTIAPAPQRPTAVSSAQRAVAGERRPAPAPEPRPVVDDRDRRDTESLAFFLALVTGALVMAVMTLGTQIGEVACLLLSGAAAALVGVLTLTLTPAADPED